MTTIEFRIIIVFQDDVGDSDEKQHVTQGCMKQELLGKLHSINEVLDKPQISEDKQLKPQDESSVVPAQPANLQHKEVNIENQYQQFLLKKKEEITKRLKEHEIENLKCDKEPWDSIEQRDKYLQRLYYDFSVHREYDDDELEKIQQQTEEKL